MMPDQRGRSIEADDDRIHGTGERSSERSIAWSLAMRALKDPVRRAYREFDPAREAWVDTTWLQAARQAARWQAAMRREGLQPGDRIAIMARNGCDWVLVDQAALGSGLVVVPLYREDRAENSLYIIRDAGVRLLVVEGPEQWNALATVRSSLDGLCRIVSLARIEHEFDPRVVERDRWLPEQGDEFEVAPVADDTLATIIYTSGTTGRSKGVMLSHGNCRENARAMLEVIRVCPDDRFLSFLPMSHVLERVIGAFASIAAGAETVFARSVPQLAEDLAAQQPTILVCVPRVYERVYGRIMERLSTQSGFANALFRKAVEVGWSRFEHAQGRGSWRPAHLLWPLLDRLVAAKLRARLGGRLRIAASGSAPLAFEVARTFIGLGVQVVQGYGLTEGGGAVSVSSEQANQPASVGRPIPGTEVRIGADDELLVRSPSVMMGYWNNASATRTAIDDEGFLHTGDQARVADGFVYITGRIKDVIVLANGEKVPPADMEMAIAGDPLFEQVLVIGEGRPYLAALVALNPEQWGSAARSAGLPPDAADMRSDEAQRLLLGRIAARLASFPGYAQVRRVVAHPGGWTIEGGMMTPTMKLRRTHILAAHADDIAWLYHGH